MTIDERVEDLMNKLPRSNDTAKRLSILYALKSIARDQRHACAESLTTLIAKPDAGYVDWNEAHQAVMNAELPK